MKNFDSYADELKNNIKAYRNGRRDFTIEELNRIKFYLLEYKDVLANTIFFKGTVKETNIISCFAEKFYEEFFSHMLEKLSADAAIIVNITANKVLFKKNETNTTVDICKLVKLLCDGECYKDKQHVAYGSITDNFVKFTKLLNTQ